MSKPKTIIVTIPNMISKDDWKNLTDFSVVEYVEREKVTTEELLDIISGYDYLMLNRDVVDTLDAKFYQEIGKRNLPLRAISTDITGMKWANPEIAEKHEIILMNTPGYSTVSVAEFSLALLLMMVKGIYKVWQDRLDEKEEKPHKNDVLEGKTVGVVGLGNIGTKFTELLGSLDVNILAWDRKDKGLPRIKQVSLEDVVIQSDFLSIHLATNDDTRKLFNEALLSKAKHGQIIINEADGEIVDNDALLMGLESGKIGGYACSNDAVKGHKVSDNPNVVAMPPQAWFTEHSLNQLRKIWVSNVISAISGSPANSL